MVLQRFSFNFLCSYVKPSGFLPEGFVQDLGYFSVVSHSLTGSTLKASLPILVQHSAFISFLISSPSFPASCQLWPPRCPMCLFPHKPGQIPGVCSVVKGTTPIFSVSWAYTLLLFVTASSSFLHPNYCSYITDFTSIIILTFHSQLYGHHYVDPHYLSFNIFLSLTTRLPNYQPLLFPNPFCKLLPNYLS